MAVKGEPAVLLGPHQLLWQHAGPRLLPGGAASWPGGLVQALLHSTCCWQGQWCEAEQVDMQVLQRLARPAGPWQDCSGIQEYRYRDPVAAMLLAAHPRASLTEDIAVHLTLWWDTSLSTTQQLIMTERHLRTRALAVRHRTLLEAGVQLGGQFLCQHRQLLVAQLVSVVQRALRGLICILHLMPESWLRICNTPRLVIPVYRVTMCVADCLREPVCMRAAAHEGQHHEACMSTAVDRRSCKQHKHHAAHVPPLCHSRPTMAPSTARQLGHTLTVAAVCVLHFRPPASG